MRKPQFKLTSYDKSLVDIINAADHKIVGIWAFMCSERVMHFFTSQCPEDHRPQNALDTLLNWIDTGYFSMNVIRSAALAAHAAAREVGEDNPARSAARAAGQAVSTPHVRTHAIAASGYALQAIHREGKAYDVELLVAKERDWQKQCLLNLWAKDED